MKIPASPASPSTPTRTVTGGTSAARSPAALATSVPAAPAPAPGLVTATAALLGTAPFPAARGVGALGGPQPHIRPSTSIASKQDRCGPSIPPSPSRPPSPLPPPPRPPATAAPPRASG